MSLTSARCLILRNCSGNVGPRASLQINVLIFTADRRIEKRNVAALIAPGYG